MLETIREWNPQMEIHSIWEDALDRYGCLLSSETLVAVLKMVEEHAEIPRTGTYYAPQADFLNADELKTKISGEFFGGLAVEIGYCAGHNGGMSALEYHKCSEVLAFSGDVVVFLGRMEDVDKLGGIYQMSKLEAFYVPSGTQLELYPGTLHYGAVETDEGGFRFVVCLLEGTNTPLKGKSEGRENEMLIQVNKWVLCNDQAAEEIQAGAPVWISGNTLHLNYPRQEV